MENITPGYFVKRIFLLIISFLVAPALFFIYFSLHMPLGEAFSVLIDPLVLMWNSSPLSEPFYRRLIGINDLPKNAWIMFLFLFIYLILFGITFLLNHLSRKFPVNPLLLNIFLSVLVIGIGLQFTKEAFWFQLFKPLPILVIAIGCCAARSLVRERKDHELLKRNILSVVLIVFSFFLILKTFFNSWLNNYTFSLLLPATLIFIKLVLFDLSRFTQRFSGTSLLYRTVATTFVGYFFLGYLSWTKVFLDVKTLSVGKEWDEISTFSPTFDNRDLHIKVALNLIENEIDENDDFVVFPRGVMLNYLSRHENPIGYAIFDPFALKLFGENSVLESLNKTPPAYIIFVNQAFMFYEKPFFGKDFGESIYFWIIQNYESKFLIGQKPFNSEEFGIEILKYHPKIHVEVK